LDCTFSMIFSMNYIVEDGDPPKSPREPHAEN